MFEDIEPVSHNMAEPFETLRKCELFAFCGERRNAEKGKLSELIDVEERGEFTDSFIFR